MTENNQNSEKNLQLSYSQLSNYVAGIIILSFFIFVSGYFWGKKSNIENFNMKIENDSLEDKLYSAFCCLNDSVKEGKEEQQGVQESIQAGPGVSQEQDLTSKSELYFAQLSGFGSLDSAKDFVNKLSQNGFNVKIIEKIVNNNRGKKINWYQVVTEPEENKENLDFQVRQIKKIVKLNKVNILTSVKN